MAISASANINFNYGNYSQDESFTTDVVGRDYIAGSGRALYHANVGVAITAGSYVASGGEGLMLLTNDNTVGDLMVSLDDGASWDINIPPTMTNLISVGPDHAVNVKVIQANVVHDSGGEVASVSSTTVTFDAAVASSVLGTATATLDGGSYGTGGPWLFRFTSGTVATPYDITGETVQDESSNLNSASELDLVYICDYHYVLTEK